MADKVASHPFSILIEFLVREDLKIGVFCIPESARRDPQKFSSGEFGLFVTNLLEEDAFSIEPLRVPAYVVNPL
nr:hypothetical protein [uncultured Actinoplanes sp.]